MNNNRKEMTRGEFIDKMDKLRPHIKWYVSDVAKMAGVSKQTYENYVHRGLAKKEEIWNRIYEAGFKFCSDRKISLEKALREAA